MGALSWVRLSRRVPGLVRQPELVNLEALIDAEASRQPARNLFVLSCAIPAGIATFGGLSVFLAWISGNSGLPLLLGSTLTAILAAGSWFIFWRLYRSISPSTRHLRALIAKLTQRYSTFGNIFLGEQFLSEEFASLLDEVAGIYIRHCSPEAGVAAGAPAKSVTAIEEAMAKLVEVAVTNDREGQALALVWARPVLEELRLLNQSLIDHAVIAARTRIEDPLAKLREARSEIETRVTALDELDQNLETR